MCPIFTNPLDWLKTLPNGIKTHPLKLKTSKFLGGYAPPPAPPAGVVGKGLLGKKLGAGKNEKKEKIIMHILKNETRPDSV